MKLEACPNDQNDDVVSYVLARRPSRWLGDTTLLAVALQAQICLEDGSVAVRGRVSTCWFEPLPQV
jgi:hypothetical protein